MGIMGHKLMKETEVEAAKAAGMNAVVVIRPGNSPLTEEDRAAHQVVYTFADLLN